MAYGDGNRNYRNFDWGGAVLNLFIVSFCVAIPGLIFVYLLVVLNLGKGRRLRV